MARQRKPLRYRDLLDGRGLDYEASDGWPYRIEINRATAVAGTILSAGVPEAISRRQLYARLTM
ncbi:MAG: hypothetical protein ACLSHX_10340 [Suilimivivens sp.]